MLQEGNKNKTNNVFQAFDQETGTDSGQLECTVVFTELCTVVFTELSNTRTRNSGFITRVLQCLPLCIGTTRTAGFDDDSLGACLFIFI